MTPQSNTAVWLTGFALLAVVIGGCTKNQQTDSQTTAAPASQPVATQAAAAQPAATVAADANAQPQSAASAAAAPAAVASTDGDQSGTKFEVNSLSRGTDVVTLKFSIVNNATDRISTYGRFSGHGYNNARDVSGIHLIDTVSKKKYFPLSDTDHACLCSQNVEDIAAGTRASLWVKFPAPPAGVTKITVEAPHFIPLDNVPITQ